MFLIIQHKSGLFLLGHENVLIHVQVGKQAQFLMDDADTVLPGFRGILKSHFLVPHIQGACAGLFNSGNDFHQGRLARPIFPNQHIYLAGKHIKGNLVQGLGTRINLVNLLCVKADALPAFNC